METFSFFFLTFLSVISANPFRHRRFGHRYDYENGMRPEFENGMRPGFENGILPPGMDIENGMLPGIEMGFENSMNPDNAMIPGFGSNLETGRRNGISRDGLGYFGQFSNGNDYAGRHFNKGASGVETHGVHNAAGKHYHNIGSHHHHSKSIKEEDSDESHNIGGGEGFDNSAHSGAGFQNYQNGAEEYGNQFANGAAGVRM
ncbi:unnamed protein product [Pieris brassicae]|uniref:Glycine-rich protein n=1 Tax=Pieris brassicae TaxID=7116 RepID=A0A9P0SMF9_PIEBR|nr:unnamed protein product [Pieris brassicae]